MGSPLTRVADGLMRSPLRGNSSGFIPARSMIPRAQESVWWKYAGSWRDINMTGLTA